MALSNWQKFRIDRGVNTNTQDSDEERAYKQEVSRQRYEAANNYLDFNNRVKQNPTVSAPVQNVNTDPQGLNEINDVLNGNGVPQALKKYNEDYMNIPEQARGLVHAFGENYADSKTNSKQRIQDAEQIKSMTGMNDVQDLLTGARQMAKYNQDVKNNNAYSWLSDPQKIEYARQQIDSVRDPLLRKELGYLVEDYSNFRDPISEVTRKFTTTNFDVRRLMNDYGISKQEAEDYVEYASILGAENVNKTVTDATKINENDSAAMKAAKGTYNSVASVGGNLLGGFSSVAGKALSRNNKLGYVGNSPYNLFSDYATEARSQVSQNAIGEDHPVVNTIYNGIMSASDMMASAAIGKGSGIENAYTLAQYAANSYENTYKQGKEIGLSDSDANKLGMSSAAIETLTELVSVDILYDMYKKNKAGQSIARDFLARLGFEPIEELFGNILNRAAEDYIIGYTGLSEKDRSVQNYIDAGNTPEEAEKLYEKDFWDGVKNDMIVAAISSGISGAPDMTINTYKAVKTKKESTANRADIKEAYKEEYNSNEALTEEDKIAKQEAAKYYKNPVRAQVDMIDDTTEEGKARKEAAQYYADKYEKKGKLSAFDELDLNYLVKGDQSASQRFRQYQADLGNSTNGMNETEFRTEAIAAIKEGDADKLSTIVNAARKSTNSYLRSDVDAIAEEFRGMAESNGITAEQFDSAMVTTEDAYNAGYNNTEVGQLTKIQKEAYNEGTKVRIEERAAEVKEKIKDYDEKTAKVFQSNMNNSLSVDQNQNAFNSILKKSQSGMSLKSMLKDPSAIALGEEATKNIRNYGIAQYNNSLNRERAKVLAEQKLVKKGTGVFEDNRTNAQKSFDTSGLSMIAKATGFNFELTDNRSDGTKATFDPGKSLISVTEGHMQQIHHELSEVTEFYNLSEYDGLRKAALEFGKDTYGENGLSLMLDAFHTSYLSDTQTMYDSSTELANDIIASIMVMPENQQKFADFIAKRYSEKEAKTFKDQIKALLEKLINSFKSIFASIDMPDYQRAIANSKVEAASKLADQYIAALEKALDNYDELNSESVGGSPEVRKSVTTIAEALGLHLEMKDGMAKFVDDYGNEIKHFTPSMIQNTQMGAVLKYAKDENANRRFNISDSDLENEYKMLSDLFNQMIEMKDIDLVWAINSAVGYQQVADGSYASKTKNKFSAFTSNADPQYASTIDFTTICLKTQAIVDAMSGTMKELGRGLTKEEIVDIVYKNTHEAGEPVPCPVCYVFSRWVGLGGLLDRINTLQNKYPKTMDINKIQDILNNLEKEKQSIKKKMGEDAKVDKVLRAEYDVLAARDFSSKTIPELKLSAKEQKRFDILSQYMDVMDQEAWFKNVRLNPKYEPVPQNILFDINAGRQFAEDYPLTWKFRTTRGSGMGKATIPYSDMQLGQVIRGISSPTAVNKGTLGNLESDPFLFDKNKQRVRGGELSASAKTILNNAIKNQKAQNLYNGQRIQSTSDFRYEYGLDYLMAYMELQAVAAKVQMYTKVPESVIMHASVNSEVNCSIMPLGYGYVADKNGNPILDENGKIQLIFSSVTGMHPDDAFNLSSMFDNVQPIIVGIGNTHIRACMADDRISFIIPYHASGSTEARYVSMMKTIEESVVNRQDYSEYQNDIEKEDATKEQIAASEMRKNILTGKYWTKGQKGVVELSKAEKQILKNNSYLDNLYRRFYVEGVDPDCYKVVIKSKPASMIMPYEYWNTGLTIKDADQNTARFKEYCESLGIIPRFSGYKKGGKYNAEFDFTNEAGYWKLLPDRRMYNRDGTYHVQKTINVANFKLDYLSKTESEKGIVMPSKVNDKSKVKGIVEKSVADINKASVRESREVNSEGIELSEEQSDFFKDSKVRDDNGNLLVVYHGTDNYGFTVFDPSVVDDKLSLFFTNDRTMASTYTANTDNVYSVYLNLKNPLIVDAHSRKWNDLRLGDNKDPLIDKIERLIDIEHNYDDAIDIGTVIEGAGDLESSSEYIIDDSGDLFTEEEKSEIRQLSREIDESYNNWEDIEDEDGNTIDFRDYVVNNRSKRLSTRKIGAYAKKNGYDGVIIKNVYDNGKYYVDHGIQGFGNVYIAFESNQVKSTINQNPTSSPDIRYSKEIMTDDEFIDSLLDDDLFDELFAAEEIKILDDWKDIKINSIMNDLREKIENAPPKQRKAIEHHLTRKALGDAFQVKGKTVAFKDERIDKYLRMFGNSSDNYAQAYITYMSPSDYMLMTANGKKGSSIFNRLVNESHEFNEEEFTKAIDSQPIFLDINEDYKISRVIGHEGRHRMIALQLAGYTEIPVLIFDSDNKYSKSYIPSMRLKPQDFTGDSNYNKSNEITLYDIEPLSFGNRENVIAKFGSGKNADIRFSREVDDVLWDIMNEDNPTIDQSILDKGLAALKGKQVDTRAINKIANDIKNQYGSNINSKELSDMLSRAFAYLHKQGYVTYNDVISLFEEVARPVLDNSTKLDNVEEYNSFKDYFKDKKIKLTETQMAEVKSQYGSYSDFQRAMYPIQFSVKGDITLDSMWGDLVETFPGFIEWVNVGDQPATLNDKLNAIKPKPQNNYGADAEEVGKDLAVEIVQKYFEAQNDANAKKLAAKLAESEKQYRAEVRDRYQKKYQEAKSKLSKSAAFDEYNKKLADIKAKSKDRQMKAKDRREAAKMKKEISQTVANLHEMITNPTEKKHVPSKMVEPLTEFLSCLDFVEPKPTYNKKTGKYELKVYDYNDRYDGKNHLHFITLEADTVPDVIKKYYDALDAGKGSSAVKGWREKMINLQNMFNPTYTEEGMEDVFNMLDADLVDAFQEILDNNKHTVSINNLKSEELEVINLALKNIKKAIAEQNKAFTMKAEISAAAHGIMNTADSVKNASHSVPYNVYKTTNIHHGLNQMFVMNMMTPETYFNMLGGYGKDIYGAFQNALEKKILKVKQTSEFMTELLGDVDTKALRDTKNAKTFQVSEGEITMTPAQIMSLYELSKRNQAVLHFAGGIEVERMGFGKVVKRYSNQNTGIHLSPSELQKIFSELTEDQIKVADAIQKYMAEVCGSWGNEVSLLMYDYEKFLDPNYFPIVTDSDTNLSKNEDGNDRLFNAVERMGITKSVNKYASNPIIVKDIFDVFVKHASDMATYYAYAPVIKDALRVYNYKEIETDGNDNKNYIPLKKALNYCVERSDNAGRKYYEDFIRDVNGLEKSNELSHGFDQFVSGYKAAAVGGNIRVVVQQPNAYTRAAMLIDPKYLAEAVPGMAISKKKMEELKDKHPLIYWKSQGYYETNVGKSLDSIITGEEGFRDRAIELSMALAGKADDITWSCLYNACERQIADKNPDLSGDEYKAAVDKLFTDAIHETQVVDATIMKSPWQRSKSATSKLLTSFMAEPIKSYNIGLNTAIQLTRGNLSKDQKIKLATKTAMVLLVTDALTAVSQSIIDGIRHHDDDDKDYWEQVAAYWFKNMLDNINPFGKVPFIKDVFEGIQNVINDESTSSSAGQLQEYMVMNSFLDAMSTTKKVITGNYNKTWYSAYMSIAKAASQLSGIPIYNVSKDFTSFWNFTFGDIYKFRKEAEKESDYYKAIISAIDSGRSDEDINEAIAKAMSKDGTVYNASSKVSSTYKTRYLEAKEERDVEAQTEAKDNLERGLKALGFSDDEIENTIAKWDEENVSMSNLYDAIQSGEGIEDITNKLLETKKPDDILKNLYERFGTTVDMNRDRKIDSNIEANLEKALDIIDGSDYDSLKTTQEANAKAKAEETAMTEKKNTYKQKVNDLIESGGDYKTTINEYINIGKDPSDIKSDISKEYREKVVEMYQMRDSNLSAYVERIARIRAYCDQAANLEIGKSYNGNYYQYEMDFINYDSKWLAKEKPSKK